MNDQQLAVVKQALEALLINCGGNTEGIGKEAITALQSIIDQDALYKMAEDAVTIGLSYNDWPKIGCVNHDCDKCKAVQEPVAVVSGYYGGRCVILPINPARLFNSGTALYTTTQRPWVGLTGPETVEIWIQVDGELSGGADRFARAIETKLKEKNT
jgi:hypothetical protein